MKAIGRISPDPTRLVAGSRDRTLADAPELDHTMAPEILFLLDKLEKAGK